MRKAVAVALVLIAGAAVVLWFGNRLNSWVLGGLIGGLASLLLSIPIAWTLFTYFSRQHEEQRQYLQEHSRRVRSRRSTSFTDYGQHQFEPAYDDDAFNHEYLAREVEGEIYTIAEEPYHSPNTRRKSGWLDEEFGHSAPPARQIPPAASSRYSTENGSSRYLPAPYSSQQQKTTPPTRQSTQYEEEKETRITRRGGYPDLPASQQGQFRSRFHSEALRTARLEAVRQYMEENDAFPSQIPIHDETSPSSRGKRSFRQEAQDTRGYDRSKQGRRPQTNHLIPDSSSDDIRRPLQRRAPYSYEDDEVRQEMSRYSEEPSVRRSSRYLRRRKDED